MSELSKFEKDFQEESKEQSNLELATERKEICEAEVKIQLANLVGAKVQAKNAVKSAKKEQKRTICAVGETFHKENYVSNVLYCKNQVENAETKLKALEDLEKYWNNYSKENF